MNKITLSLLIAILYAMPAQASWTLNDDDSTLSFISTKAVNIAEIHKFTTLAGSVDDTGNVMVSIALASVDTGIEIRDDRMREMLFDTGNYASATMTAQVNMTMLGELASGESKAMAVEGELALHGQSTAMTFEIVVARMSDGNLLVMSQKPVVVNAPLFNLADGVEALRVIAGLPSISAAVPVSFVLSFDAD